MFPLLIPMAIGAGAGALMNKDKPLKGALMGAGLGAAGGAAAPALGGLLGGGAASAAPGAAAAAGAAPAAGFGIGQPLVTGAMGSSSMAGGASAAGNAGGMMGGMKGLLDTANAYAPLVGTMASFAPGGSEQPSVQAPAPTVGQGGAETLAALAGQPGDSMLAADAQARAQRRAGRRMY